MSNKNLNFSIEFQYRVSFEKQQFIICYRIALYSRKNDNKLSSEMRNYHRSSYFTVTKVLLGLGPILTTGLKYRLTVKFLQMFFTYRLSYENKSHSSTE